MVTIKSLNVVLTPYRSHCVCKVSVCAGNRKCPYTLTFGIFVHVCCATLTKLYHIKFGTGHNFIWIFEKKKPYKTRIFILRFSEFQICTILSLSTINHQPHYAPIIVKGAQTREGKCINWRQSYRYLTRVVDLVDGYRSRLQSVYLSLSH